MNEESGKFLAGGKVGSWNAPNITSDPVSGIGNWSEDEIATFLKIGVVHGKAIAAGEMGLAVQNSFSKMADGDLRSIAAYIRTVPAKPGSDKTPRSGGTHSAPMPITKLESPLDTRDYKAFMMVAGMSGAQIYDGACATGTWGAALASTTAPMLDQQDVAKVVAVAEREIAAAGSNGCVAVVDAAGMLLFFKRLDGAMPGCIDAALLKARTSAYFHSPSVSFMNRLAQGQTSVLGIPNAIPLGGGYPLKIGEHFVGTVGISTPKQELDNATAESAAAAVSAGASSASGSTRTEK